MAPEMLDGYQLRTDGCSFGLYGQGDECSPALDVWSAGCVFIEMLTGGCMSGVLAGSV